MYDYRCGAGHEHEALLPLGTQTMPCRTCGAEASRVWRTCPTVIADSIPGGLLVENMTATPETFYSKSEHRRRMKELGLSLREFHVSAPGTDKNRHSTKWY